MALSAPAAANEEILARVQELQSRLAEQDATATRELAEELVAAVVQMYGAGLEQIVATLHRAGEDGERLAAALADDPLVATLLLIHDLHPEPLQSRVAAALEQVRPYMESHGGDVELLGLADGVARIRLQGSCSDCAASTVTLELAIKQALDDHAPDLAGLEVEGAQTASVGPELPMAPVPDAVPGQEPLQISLVAPATRGAADGNGTGPAPAAPPAWFEVDHLDILPDGRVSAVDVAGANLVVANVDGVLLAYRDRCPGCSARLHEGALQDGALACPGCGRSYFLPRAGRSLDDEHLQLQPVPLLRDQGQVKVALPA
jgi:Fe-S cluster biogenesis protein NfuA/nitrite reductase/ring-hydroxylating ferredoxin subunit